jgi:hypothetical protein
MGEVGERTVTFRCTDNDSYINLCLVDGLLDEIQVSDTDGAEWTIVSAKDLKEALHKAGYSLVTNGDARVISDAENMVDVLKAGMLTADETMFVEFCLASGVSGNVVRDHVNRWSSYRMLKEFERPNKGAKQ